MVAQHNAKLWFVHQRSGNQYVAKKLKNGTTVDPRDFISKTKMSEAKELFYDNLAIAIETIQTDGRRDKSRMKYIQRFTSVL